MPKTIEQSADVETTTITLTNDEWCQIHIALLNRRSDLFRTRDYELGESLGPIAKRIEQETRNFHGVK